MAFIEGPLVWIAFAVLIGGSAYRLLRIARLARAEGHVLPTLDAWYGARSVLHWMLPFGSRSMRGRPLFTALSFLFHACLLLTPLLAMGHAVLWERAWGVHLWSLPAGLTDTMTLAVLVLGGLLALRRLTAPEVRYVSRWSDWVVLAIVIAPFATGYAAHHDWLAPATATALHIVTGALWLAALPFTRLSHMLLFALTRAYMGSEFGAVRHARDW